MMCHKMLIFFIRFVFFSKIWLSDYFSSQSTDVKMSNQMISLALILCTCMYKWSREECGYMCVHMPVEVRGQVSCLLLLLLLNF